MTAQWEAGRKAHTAFHAAQKDTWAVYTWQILTGDRSGSYLTASPGHHWSDFDARSIQIRQSGTTVTSFPERSSDAFNPRASFLYRLGHGTALTASGYRAFRAPTLNELYRRFSKGTVLTLPNNALGPERLVGGEAGVNLQPARNATVRLTWFDNRVHNPVSNITISQTGPNVTVQRQNPPTGGSGELDTHLFQSSADAEGP